ncbi:alpha/beta fold hydrolase [Nocardia blacklockiae]|uniref:alpha/beta fold hydrolase n=1 Tax=Nocardia blacklockiae TaxID=480036 RepID=UPI001894E0A6|nr:alpha/beta fold hydrolase [Nocardia blacklockiae]MBF6175136.1 alpha/beta hydrolase [Nocardia blacklockiae]
MRWTRAALLATSSLTLLLTTACGAGPSERPGVAVERPHEAGGQAGPTTSAAPAPPALETPKTDLSWRECATPTFNLLGLGAPPAGLIFECAEYSTPIDTGGGILGSFRAGAVRARLQQTPAGAAPLVLTSGSDRSSTATLAGLAAGPAAAVLAEHPLVAVDRRGMGSSQPIDCMTPETRRAVADNGQFASGGGDPVDAMAKLSQDATIACQDFLQPYQGTFDAAHAADDIEQLRKQWQVNTLALIGTGNGARIGLAYAAKYGDHLSRLVLDSPEAVNADSVGRAEQRVKGAEAALSGFSQRCAAIGCALGANPRAAITDLVNRAAAGQLGDLSANVLLTTISGFLGDPRADQIGHITELADALAAAGRGDRGPLGGLVLRESAAVASDGQFVARCSDNQQPATPTRAKELQNTWAGQYPVFGKAAATRLMACSAWPVPNPPQLPEKYTGPVLVFGTAADPVAGGEGRPAVTGVLGAAGARTASVEWQGWGHPVFTHTGCAQQYLNAYAKDAKLPLDGTACPA